MTRFCPDCNAPCFDDHDVEVNGETDAAVFYCSVCDLYFEHKLDPEVSDRYKGDEK